jgi:hypothetical protein
LVRFVGTAQFPRLQNTRSDFGRWRSLRVSWGGDPRSDDLPASVTISSTHLLSISIPLDGQTKLPSVLEHAPAGHQTAGRLPARSSARTGRPKHRCGPARALNRARTQVGLNAVQEDLPLRKQNRIRPCPPSGSKCHCVRLPAQTPDQNFPTGAEYMSPSFRTCNHVSGCTRPR